MTRLMQIACAVAASASLSLPLSATAAEPESCPGLIASRDTLFSRAALRRDEVGLTFVGHATFVIETPQGVRIATDYSDGTRPHVTPDVATMNKAHSTHFSYRPDPGITHVLRGWNSAGGPAVHDLTMQDVRIRNVSTNIRSYGGATEQTVTPSSCSRPPSCASRTWGISITPSRPIISQSSGVLMFCWCR